MDKEPSQVLRLDRWRSIAWLNYVVKAALVVSFAIAIFFPPDVLEGKAMGSRAPLFLAPAVLVPLLARWRNWQPYPHTADALCSDHWWVCTCSVRTRTRGRGCVPSLPVKQRGDAPELSQPGGNIQVG